MLPSKPLKGSAPFKVMAGILLHPKRRPVARTIQGLSCRGIARTRAVLASQSHLGASVSLEVLSHCQERPRDPIVSRHQACHRPARPRAAAACSRVSATRQRTISRTFDESKTRNLDAPKKPLWKKGARACQDNTLVCIKGT
jgi:hypothetical protein